MKSLRFQVIKPDGNETHYIDLKNRHDRIDGPGFKMGFDGEDVWASADSTFDGDPRLYHNFYFYFLAMPFLLADDAIQYSKAEPITFEEQTYPGIKITCKDGVGPADEYYLHYDPRFYRMRWLGYKLGGSAIEKTGNINWIRYEDWQYLERLYMPQSITWYKMENGQITEPWNTVEFDSVIINSHRHRAGVLEKPVGAIVLAE